MKNVLNYFVRKAFGFRATATAEDKTLFGHLLRIRQNIQGVYDWLYGRLSAEHLPKRMPMTEAVTDPNDGHEVRRPVLQNSDTLLAHLRLLDGRKITNGYQDGTPADDGLPDGVSLARIFCDSSLQPTELVDDNVGWVMDKTPTLPSTLTKVVLGCKKATETTNIPAGVKRVEFPHLEEYNRGVLLVCDGSEGVEFPKLQTITAYNDNAPTINLAGTKRLSMPSLINVQSIGNTTFCQGENLEEIEWQSFIGYGPTTWGGWATLIGGVPNLKKLVFGRLQYSLKQQNANTSILALGSSPNLLHLEIGEGTAVSLMLDTWSPTLDSSNLSLFLDNFLHFIAERVAEGNFTLTLSAAVFSAIWDADGNPAVVGDGNDDLRAAINTELRYNKKWNVNKA